jgi:hypothetical protein
MFGGMRVLRKTEEGKGTRAENKKNRTDIVHATSAFFKAVQLCMDVG